MRIFALFALSLLMAQQQEAYPGQSTHAKPPDGWTCSRPGIGVEPEHVCSCRRMKENCSEGCDDETPVREDPTCTVFCHPASCSCPIHCDSQ